MCMAVSGLPFLAVDFVLGADAEAALVLEGGEVDDVEKDGPPDDRLGL